MRIAILDLGTNTFNLVIADIDKKNYTAIFNDKIPVKLGEGGINERLIAPESFSRGIAAVKKHLEKIKEFGTKKTFAFATSAIRGATNGKEFTLKILAETGVEVTIIDGNTEAEYIYHGVKQALELNNSPQLIMDIGGGSTEFIIANKYSILWKKSYDLGVSRLLETHKPQDPLSAQDCINIEKHLLNELTELWDICKKYSPDTLIGSSGSFDSFAEMIAHRFYTPEIIENKTSYDFNLSDFYQIHHTLLTSSLKERLQMKGLIPMRADMIVIASIFICLVLEKANINKMKLSTYALKEGVLWKLCNESEYFV
jgi:exopolyphosphatase / guanosine-5'-triphosphate,3'-diphosphate pyrophosphatase